MGSPFQTVTYGSFVFPFARLSVTSGVIYGPDGFTLVGRRYNFTVSGVIGGVSQGDLGSKIIQMQTQLKKPRQTLLINWTGDGNTNLFNYVFDAGSVTQGGDIDWGPKPGDLNIQHFSGGRSAFYTWTCSVNTMDSTVSSDVLAISWNWSHSIDPSGYTTRTVSGKLLLDSAVVANGQSADFYRNVITQAIPVILYFKRELQEWNQSEDGRILSFSITDVEQHYTLPSPITAGHASWMVRLHGYAEAAPLTIDYVLSGWFESSAAHGKNEIIQAIFTLVNDKFGAVSDNNPVIFTERVMREDVFGRNRVDFEISAIQPGGAGFGNNGGSAATGTLSNGNIDLAAGLQTFGIQPSGSDGNPIAINPYGQTDGLGSGSFARAPLINGQIYDADPQSIVTVSGGYQFADNGAPNNLAPPGPTGGNAPTTGDTQPPTLGGISDLHGQTPFIAFHETIDYFIDNNMVRLVPKLAGKDPIVQQAAVPTMTITQAGYSKQIAKKASDIPYFGNPPYWDFPISQSYISLPNVEPIADGTYNVYSTSWRYVYLVDQSLSSDGISVTKLPFDPRRPGSTNTVLDLGQLPYGSENALPETSDSILEDPQT